jgi:hypothetical protein
MAKFLRFFAFFITFLIVIATYTITLKGTRGNIPIEFVKGIYDQATQPLELSSERGRFLLTKSLAENNSFALSQTYADAALPDVGIYNGNFFVYFAPGISIWALPFYLLGSAYNLGQVFAFASIIIFALTNGFLIYYISTKTLKLPTWAGLSAWLIFAIGSTSLSYANTLYQHHATTFFLLSAFISTWKISAGSKLTFLHAAWVWIAYALSIWIDYPNVILLLPIMVYFAITVFQIHWTQHKLYIQFKLNGIITSIFFIALTGLHGYYNYIHFDSPTRLSGQLVGYKTYLDAQKQQEANEINLADLQAKKESQLFFREELLLSGLYTLTIAPDKGLFVFSPVFLLSLAGLFLFLKHAKVATVVLFATVVTHILLYSSWGDPWGGWAYGPRYLIPSMSILSISIVYFLAHTKLAPIYKAIAIPLFAYSCVISLVGALTTKAVPPKVEADYLNTQYGPAYVWQFFNQNRSGSFIYNTYLAQSTSLQEIMFYLVFIAVALLSLLFIIPDLAYGLTHAAKVESIIQKQKKFEAETYLDRIFFPIRKAIGQFIIWLSRGVL